MITNNRNTVYYLILKLDDGFQRNPAKTFSHIKGQILPNLMMVDVVAEVLNIIKTASGADPLSGSVSIVR
jgi:hypothetical protein